jgi:hypothetical protein
VSPADSAINLMNVGGVTRMATTSMLDLNTLVMTAGRAGFVFDRYSDTDFKFAAIDLATKQVLIGHRTAGGWVVDAAVSNTSLSATREYLFGVSLRGSTVSVTLNGQAAVGFAFNGVAVDGRFGLFSKGASASFNWVTVRTNDPSVPTTQMSAAGTSLATKGWTAPTASPTLIETETRPESVKLTGSAVGALAPRIAIDWSARAVPEVRGGPVDDTDRRDDWQGQFVNHLGSSYEQRNPNEGLEIRVAGRGDGSDEPDTL